MNYVKVNIDNLESLNEGYAGLLGESVSTSCSYAVVPIILVDDDRLIHLNWKAHCKKNSLEFHGFYSIKAFLGDSSSFNKASIICIDSNLGVRGEIESEKIFALGFLNLYLAKGYEKGAIQKPAWIKEIYSKSPENIS